MASSAGGVAFLIALGMAFMTPRSHVKGAGSLKFHTLRAFGLEATPPPSDIDKMIDQAADYHGVERSVFRALIHIESTKNPRAVSKVGARGLGQVMPANSKRCGLSSAQKLFDPLLNLGCAAQILKEEIDANKGDLSKALAVYNCGRAKCAPGQQYAALVLARAKKNV